MQPPEEVADLYAAADVNVIPLQKGLIYAALPSKTADCLLAGKPIITCVDDEAKFVRIMQEHGYENSNPEVPEELCNLIRKSNLFFRPKMIDFFSRDRNVLEHCKLVEGI